MTFLVVQDEPAPGPAAGPPLAGGAPLRPTYSAPWSLQGRPCSALAPGRRSSPYAQGAGYRCGILLPVTLPGGAWPPSARARRDPQAEHNGLEAGVLLQHPAHGLAASAAQGLSLIHIYQQCYK